MTLPLIAVCPGFNVLDDEMAVAIPRRWRKLHRVETPVTTPVASLVTTVMR